MAGSSAQALVLLKEDGWGSGEKVIVPPIGVETGSGFGYDERLFYAYRDGAVMDYGDYEARDLMDMLKRDYKARQIESCLTLPILSAEHKVSGIKGDTGESEWLQNFWETDPWDGGCENDLEEIIAQCLSAKTYKRSFFELVFAPDPTGRKIGYRKVAHRPATTCRLRRDPNNGAFLGFEQEPYYLAYGMRQQMYPIVIPAERSFVHIHGMRHNPLWGTSDMEIAYWCWQTKQKLLFLWMQFLENVALPRTVVKANDMEIAKQVARQLSMLKNSGVVPASIGNDPQGVQIDTLDVSGKGAEQFKQVIDWLDQGATHSVLAGFLDLTSQAANGAGSYALSSNASDFFLQSLESDTREIEKSIRRHLFAPLIRYNFGPRAKVPKLQFEPLNAEDKSNAISFLETMLTARAGPASDLIPADFIGALASMIAQYLGLDGVKVEADFAKAAKDAQAKAAQMAAAGNTATAQQAAAIGGAADAAFRVAQQARGRVGRKVTPPDAPMAHSVVHGGNPL